MLRSQKIEWRDTIKEAVEGSSLVIVVGWSGLTVAEMNALRGNLRRVEGSFRVVKNNLIPFALEKGDWSSLTTMVEGMSAVACAYGDITAMAKVVADFAEESGKIKIKGGMMDGQLLAINDVQTLASTPPLDVLRGRIIGALTACQGQLASLMIAPSSAVARVISAFSKKPN